MYIVDRSVASSSFTFLELSGIFLKFFSNISHPWLAECLDAECMPTASNIQCSPFPLAGFHFGKRFVCLNQNTKLGPLIGGRRESRLCLHSEPRCLLFSNQPYLSSASYLSHPTRMLLLLLFQKELGTRAGYGAPSSPSSQQSPPCSAESSSTE